MLTIPTTIKSTPLGDRAFDLYSRLLDDNIIMLDGEVTDESASLCVAQLLYLSAKDDAKDIDEIAEACERDNFLTAEEARDFGLIDHIIGC